MNKAVSKIINKYLGEWLHNLDSKQLDVSIFSGNILLENVQPRSEIFQMFGFPFELKYGKIGKISIKIPWGSLLSKPLKIEICEIYAYITPVSSSNWSESTLEDLLKKLKQSSIDNFEALLETEIEDANLPGFLKRWLTKIIENVQLTISNLYLRYEDRVTSEFNFSIGVMLEQIKAETCDANWQKAYIDESPLSYKLLEIKNFSVFCDYDVDMILFQEVYTDPIEDAFSELANHDIAGMVQHNYVLVPFTIEAQLTISKTISNSYPLLNAKVTSKEFCLNIYTGQIKAALQLLQLINLFLLFSAGIEKKINTKQLTEAEADNYIGCYIKYRKAVKADKGKKIEKYKKLLSAVDVYIKLESIIELRELVIHSMNKERLISEKLVIINKLKKKKMEKPSKFKMFFNSLAEIEHEKKIKRKSEQLNSAKLELKALIERNSPEKIEEKSDPDWLKVFLFVGIGKIFINLFHKGKSLTQVNLDDLIFALGMKSSVFMDLHIHSLIIKNFIEKDSYFPLFFETNLLSMGIQENPLKIKLLCEQCYIYFVTEPLVKILNILRKTIENDINISEYSTKVQEMYDEYLVEGREYVKMLLNSKSTAIPELEINCKAPVIIIPTDSKSDSGFLVINLGEISCATTSLSLKSEQYEFNLKNFGICIVWKCHNVKEYFKGMKDDLLSPISFSAKLNVKFIENSPSIDLTAHIEEISGNINPMALNFLNTLSVTISRVIPKMKSAQNSRQYSQKFEPVQVAEEPIQGFPVRISIILDRVVLKIKSINSSLCNAGVDRIHVRVDMTAEGTIQMLIRLKSIYVDDMTKNSLYPNILSWPVLSEDDSQADLNILMSSSPSVMDIGISVKGMKVILYSAFVESMQKFIITNLDSFSIPTFQTSAKQLNSRFSQESTQYLRLSLNLQNFELWMPETSSDTVVFSLSGALEYIGRSNQRNYLSSAGIMLSSVTMSSLDELSFSATHIELSLLPNSDLGFPKPILSPFRLHGELTISQNENVESDQINAQINLETILIQISIADLFIFLRLASEWRFLQIPELSKDDYFMMFQLENIKCKVLDERNESIRKLISVQIKGVDVKYTKNKIEDCMRCCVELAVDYYSRRYSVWEPLLESSVFDVEIRNVEKAVQIKINCGTTINVNVTYTVVQILAEVIEELRSFCKPKTSAYYYSEQVEYVFDNKLSQEIIMWMPQTLDKWKVASSSQTTFNHSYIQHLRAASMKPAKLTALMSALNPPITIEFQFACDNSAVFSFLLEENSMKVFKVSSGPSKIKYFVNNFSEGLRRIIRFEPGVFIAANYINPGVLRPVPEAELLKGSEIYISPLLGHIDTSTEFTQETENMTLVMEINEILVDNGGTLTLIEFNPLCVIKNLLLDDIEILHYSEVLQRIEPGKTEHCKFNPTFQYSLRVAGLVSPPLVLFEPKQQVKRVKFFEAPKCSILIRAIQNSGWVYPDLDLSNKPRTPRDSSVCSWMLEIFSSYIAINHSQLDLNISGLSLPRSHQQYCSKKRNKISISLLQDNSKSSKMFQIDTIGVSGRLKLPNPETVPDYFSVGVCITQAPGFLLYTKILTFVPRYIIWNHLNFPVFLKQSGLASRRILHINESLGEDSVKPVVLELDSCKSSKTLQLSTDSLHWSSAFAINRISDIQVRVKSELSDIENLASVFEKSWFHPSKYNGGYRVIRIIINTSNEASLNVSFMDPIEPEFRIVNKTEEEIKVNQIGNEEYLQVPAFQSCEWVWRDLVAKVKKIEVSTVEFKAKYSLGKIKKYGKKPFKDSSVKVVVNGGTRELLIRSKEVKEAKRAQKSNARKENVMILKDGSEYNVLNPRYAVQGSLMSLTELESSIDLILVTLLGKEAKIFLSLNLQSIGISLIDKAQNENFYIYIGEILVSIDSHIITLGSKQKISTKIKSSISSIQIDVIDSDPKIFPVLLCSISQRTSNGEKSGVFLAEIEHLMIVKESKGKFEVAHEFDNFEIALSTLNVTLNEETLYKILEFRHFLALFSNLTSHTEGLKDSIAKSPITKPKDSEIVSKSYFRFLKLRAMKVALTIRQSSRTIPLDFFSDSTLFNIARSFAGALVTISESTFTFKEIIILNAFESFDNLLVLLTRQYIRQGILQFYKVIGSIDILGNPLSLFDSLGTAVYEFVAEPARGLLGGPKAFAIGLGKGVRALVAGILAGSFGSVTKVTESMYQVLRRATNDDSSQHALNHSIGKNALMGFSDSFKDLSNGVTQVATKPYKGYKKQGTKGMILGAAFGGLGLISSPVKFALKFSHTISAAMYSISILILKGRINAQSRIRFPRFNGLRNVIQKYSQDFAPIKALLSDLTSKVVYYSEIRLEPPYSKNVTVVLLVTLDEFLYFIDGKIHLKTKIAEIQQIELHSYEKLYFLCIASKDLCFSVPSRHLKHLYTIYAIISTASPESQIVKHTKFPCPSYMSLSYIKSLKINY